jgi:hypothetical protein
MVSFEVSNHTEKEMSSKIDFELISSIYEDISGMLHSVPTSDMIFNQYNMILEHRLASLRANLYPDDIYEGGPGQSCRDDLLPDYVVADLHTYIKMELVTLDDIEKCLEFYNLVFIREEIQSKRTLVNQVILGVW